MRVSCGALFLALVACTRTAPPVPDASLVETVHAAAVIDAAPPPVVDAAPPAPTPPRGTARLLIQHVEARCFMGPGDVRTFTVGYDVLLETDDGTDAGEPERDHVFCSKHLADGGTTKPRLGIWRNCREDKSCRVATEAGADHAGVQCGKDQVTLDVVEGKTILRGPFGERVVAPYPMHVGPVARTHRFAEVDC